MPQTHAASGVVEGGPKCPPTSISADQTLALWLAHFDREVAAYRVALADPKVLLGSPAANEAAKHYYEAKEAVEEIWAHKKLVHRTAEIASTSLKERTDHALPQRT